MGRDYVARRAESGDLVALKVVDASISRAMGVAEGIEHARASILSLSDHPSLSDLVDICPLSASEAIALVKNIAIAVEVRTRRASRISR